VRATLTLLAALSLLAMGCTHRLNRTVTEYLPFGAGRPLRIGQHIAMPCMLLTFGQFAQRFEWRFEDSDVRPIGLSTLKLAVDLTAALACRR
jgi:hypothetical protein